MNIHVLLVARIMDTMLEDMMEDTAVTEAMAMIRMVMVMILMVMEDMIRMERRRRVMTRRTWPWVLLVVWLLVLLEELLLHLLWVSWPSYLYLKVALLTMLLRWLR